MEYKDIYSEFVDIKFDEYFGYYGRVDRPFVKCIQIEEDGTRRKVSMSEAKLKMIQTIQGFRHALSKSELQELMDRFEDLLEVEGEIARSNHA